jgi:hypothetical protein
MSGVLSTCRHVGGHRVASFRAHFRTPALQQKTSPFDDPIGADEQRERHGESERLDGLEVDDRLDFGVTR